MLTVAQITAESGAALTEIEQQSLLSLIKRWKVYRANVGLWPNLTAVFAAEVATPTVKTQALRAVLTLLADLPSIVVESNGNDDSRSFFATELNWDSLAKTALDVLYDVPIAEGRTSIAVVQRTIPNMVIDEAFYINEEGTGRIL